MRDFSQQFCCEDTEFLDISSSTLLDIEEDPSFVCEYSDASESDVSQLLEEVDFVKERKFVVCESQLDELLSRMFCAQCAEKSSSSSKNVSGTNISVKMLCSNGHEVLNWCSQQKVGKLFSFNLLLNCFLRYLLLQIESF